MTLEPTVIIRLDPRRLRSKLG